MLLANRLRCVVSGPTILVTLGAFPLGWVSASAQTAPPPPAEVPYLNFPRSQLPEKARPRSAPAPATDPSASPAPARPAANLKQREQELEAIRAEQKRSLENEARLKREVGGDRRRPPQTQSAAHRRGRAGAHPGRRDRLRSNSVWRRLTNANKRCASRSRDAAMRSPRCWRPCSASAGSRRPPSWSRPKTRSIRYARRCCSVRCCLRCGRRPRR